MIATVTGESVVFEGALERREVAYIDADALPRTGAAEVATLVLPQGDGSEDRAWRAVLGKAVAVVSALDGVAGAIDVVGEGAAAQCVRQLLGDRADSSRPRAGVADLTGDPAAIVEGTRRLEPLGTLILAGETTGRPSLDLELYPDVHLRGLRLIGVGALASEEPVAAEIQPDAPLTTRRGEPATRAARWYRVIP